MKVSLSYSFCWIPLYFHLLNANKELHFMCLTWVLLLMFFLAPLCLRYGVQRRHKGNSISSALPRIMFESHNLFQNNTTGMGNSTNLTSYLRYFLVLLEYFTWAFELHTNLEQRKNGWGWRLKCHLSFHIICMSFLLHFHVSSRRLYYDRQMT